MATSITFYQDQETIDVYFTQGTNLSAIEVFANDIAQYSGAQIDQVCYAQSAQLAISASTQDAYPFGLYAKILLREQNTGKIHGVNIHAPIKSMFYQVDNRGFKVKQEIGQQIAAFYSSMSGSPHNFKDGWLCGNTR